MKRTFSLLAIFADLRVSLRAQSPEPKPASLPDAQAMRSLAPQR